MTFENYEYQNLLDALKNCLNSRATKWSNQNNDLFKGAILTLKNKFGVTLSTEFLKNLSGIDGHKGSMKVWKMLKNNGFTTEEYFKPFVEKKSRVRVKDIPSHKVKVWNTDKKTGVISCVWAGRLPFSIEVLENYKLKDNKVFYMIN